MEDIDKIVREFYNIIFPKIIDGPKIGLVQLREIDISGIGFTFRGNLSSGKA